MLSTIQAWSGSWIVISVLVAVLVRNSHGTLPASTFTVCIDSPLHSQVQTRIRTGDTKVVSSAVQASLLIASARCIAIGVGSDFMQLGINNASHIWHLNGQQIVGFGAYGIVSEQFSFASGSEEMLRSELRWPSKLTKSLTGNYSCRVGSDVAEFQLVVVDPPNIMAVTPSFTVAVGQRATLSCTASGDDPLTLSWYHGNTVVATTTAEKSVVYVVSTATYAHEGGYRCVASNNVDTVWSNSTITIVGPPSFTGSTLAPILVPTSLTTSSATLQFPAPFDGNSPITGYRIVCTPQSQYAGFATPREYSPAIPSVPMLGLEPGARYDCLYYASNVVGESGPSAVLPLRMNDASSGEVQNLKVTMTSPASAEVQFQEPDISQRNGDITSYRLSYSNVSCHTATKTCPCSLYQCDLSKTIDISYPPTQVHQIVFLRYYTTYSLTVSAVNRAGPGKASTVTFTTRERAPGPTSSMTVRVASSKGITIKWEEPLEPNGIILTYQISVKQSGKGTTLFSEENRPASDERALYMTKLEPGTQYTVTLSSTNAAGPGPVQTSTVTTLGE
eukprot:scpid56408/ scgid2495/ Down syndrome cell adhesion molecule homolog